MMGRLDEVTFMTNPQSHLLKTIAIGLCMRTNFRTSVDHMEAQLKTSIRALVHSPVARDALEMWYLFNMGLIDQQGLLGASLDLLNQHKTSFTKIYQDFVSAVDQESSFNNSKYLDIISVISKKTNTCIGIPKLAMHSFDAHQLDLGFQQVKQLDFASDQPPLAIFKCEGPFYYVGQSLGHSLKASNNSAMQYLTSMNVKAHAQGLAPYNWSFEQRWSSEEVEAAKTLVALKSS